jgi:hypothetical protein
MIPIPYRFKLTLLRSKEKPVHGLLTIKRAFNDGRKINIYNSPA